MHECNLCHVKLSTLAALERHNKGSCRIMKGYTYPCFYCNKLFKNKQGVRRHICINKRDIEIKIRVKLILKEIARIRFETIGINFTEWSTEDKKSVLYKVLGSTEALIEEVIKEIIEEVTKELEDLNLC